MEKRSGHVKFVTIGRKDKNISFYVKVHTNVFEFRN